MKLNKKGFTLIELLTVVVILAIILVITIPNVLDTVDTAKRKAYEDSIEIIRDYAQKEYNMCSQFGFDYNKDIFKDNTCDFKENPDTDKLVTAAGYSTEDIEISSIPIIEDKVIIVPKPKTTGKFNNEASTESALSIATNIFAEWLEKQYELEYIEASDAEKCSAEITNRSTFCEMTYKYTDNNWKTTHIVRANNAKMIQEAGINNDNVIGVFKKDPTSNKFCTCLFAMEGTAYYVKEEYIYVSSSGAAEKSATGSCSTGCNYGDDNLTISYITKK